MVGLSLSLNNALSGLNVNQQALAVLSQNIANANTVGYSKQTANLQSVYLDGNGQGVSLADVTRKVDDYLVSAVQKQNSVASYNAVLSDYHDRIQLFMGKPGSQDNISAYMDKFFGALQSLSQTPDNPNLQQGVIEAGKNIVYGITSLATGLRDLQWQADKDVKAAVTNINSDLKQIYDLNAAITNAKVLGKSVADLEDKRDILIKNISQYLDVQVGVRDEGAVTISTGSGITILDSNIYQLTYSPQAASANFTEGAVLSPLEVTRVDASGNVLGVPIKLITGGTTDSVVSAIGSGKIRALVDLRDKNIPAILSQLDTLAAGLRDTLNEVHNAGSGFPPSATYSGTRLVNAGASNGWSGNVRIAVLDANGAAVASPYTTQTGGGLVPLTIDLSTLNGGYGEGKPTVQSIIDEINQYYGVPQNKLQLGNLDDIRLASSSKKIPGAGSEFTLDFDLSNRSTSASKFYVTSFAVTDDTNTSVTSVTSDIPSINLASTGTYTTNLGSTTVTVNTDGAHGFVTGQRIYLSAPSSDVAGISASNLGGFFQITNVTSTGFDITVLQEANSGGSFDRSNVTAKPPYATVPAGESLRTVSEGGFTVDVGSNTSSQYYNVTATVVVDDGTGLLKTSQVTYRINNNRSDGLNARFAAQSATLDGVLLEPTSLDPIVTAMLVDEDGNELAKTGRNYNTQQSGYLVIKSNLAGRTVVIDSLDSSEGGIYNGSSTATGSSRNFSHYFELNNLFVSNAPTATGDTVRGSAINLALQQHVLDNPNLLSIGSLTRVPSSDGSKYVYERTPGDNSVINRMTAYVSDPVSFPAATGLAANSQSFSAYAGNIISITAQQAANADTARKTSQNLLDGFTQRASAISGVNLDTELANTVIYQNAYAASARIISVTNSLFDALLQAAQ